MEKERWDAWHNSGAQWKGNKEKRAKSKQRSKAPHLAAGCYGPEKLHHRAFFKPEVSLLIRSLSLRVLTGFGGPWLCPCMSALPEIPAASCSLKGRRRKNEWRVLAISSCW